MGRSKSQDLLYDKLCDIYPLAHISDEVYIKDLIEERGYTQKEIEKELGHKPHKMFVDIVIRDSDRTVAVEYHGEQHYSLVGNMTKTTSDLLLNQQLDREKSWILSRIGIPLVAIPYDMYIDPSIIDHLICEAEEEMNESLKSLKACPVCGRLYPKNLLWKKGCCARCYEQEEKQREEEKKLEEKLLAEEKKAEMKKKRREENRAKREAVRKNRTFRGIWDDDEEGEEEVNEVDEGVDSGEGAIEEAGAADHKTEVKKVVKAKKNVGVNSGKTASWRSFSGSGNSEVDDENYDDFDEYDSVYDGEDGNRDEYSGGYLEEIKAKRNEASKKKRREEYLIWKSSPEYQRQKEEAKRKRKEIYQKRKDAAKKAKRDAKRRERN